MANLELSVPNTPEMIYRIGSIAIESYLAGLGSGLGVSRSNC